MENFTLLLKQIPLVWTTCDKSKDRHPKMLSTLDRLGVQGEMINGPVTTPYTIGVAKGYLNAITKHKPPFIILEDDATLISNNFSFSDPIQVPKNSDALYLGTSTYGRIQKTTVNGAVIAAKVDEKIFRAFNMLAFHAVVYLSESYVDHIVNILNNFINNPVGGVDDPIADTMWKFNVYSLINPIFYQNDGRSNEATTAKINILL